MKAALGCLTLLLVLLGGSFFYSAMMAKAADDFSAHSSELANASGERRLAEALKLTDEWKSKAFYFSLSIPHAELDRIESELVRVSASAEAKNDGEFYIAVALLSDAFEHIGKLYEASLDNIL